MNEKLFTPISLGNVTMKNRIIMPSMCVHFCDKEGYVNDCMLEYVRRRAAGGAGLLIIPGSPHGKCGPGRPALSDDKYIPGWEKLANTVHQYGAKLFCQIHPAKFQAGRGHNVEKPEDYTEENIENLIKSYVACALRCQKAGVDGVDIHGAHAHEIALFMSPLYNKRADQYGGDAAGRSLFPCKIVKAIKEACGEGFPVVFRISGEELVEGGRTIEESAEIAAFLEKAGADAIHVSVGMPESGGYISAPMDVEDCFNVENAAKIKEKVSIPVIAVNRIVDVKQAVDVVASGKADMVSMARSHLADPEIVNKYLGKNNEPVFRCVGCGQGCRDSAVRKKIICMQNPLLGREELVDFVPAAEEEKKKKIMIVGAGPAGLEVACDLARRGFSPKVYEKSSRPGGLLNLASLPPHKQNLNDITKSRVALLKQFGVEIQYNTEVTPTMLTEESPDVLIVATGSTPFIPPIKGIDAPNVITADEALMGEPITGKKIALLGGGLLGCETADMLAEEGNEVVIIDMIEKVATTLNAFRRNFMLKRMAQVPIRYQLESKVEEINLPDVKISNADGIQTLTGFDMAVISTGRKPLNTLQETAEQKLPETRVFVLGDAKKVDVALSAIYDAVDVALSI